MDDLKAIDSGSFFEENGSTYIVLRGAPELEKLLEDKVSFSDWHNGYGMATLRFEPPKVASVEPKRLVEQVSDITRNRRDNYGRPLINFLRIAVLWTAYLDAQNARFVISPMDVAQMMNLLKVARLLHSYSEDSVLDVMGYADCVDDMDAELKEMGYSGIDYLDTITSSDGFPDLIQEVLKNKNTTRI